MENGMQHRSWKSFRSFVRRKGYYIVLLLCAAAVGTSGYFLLTKDPAPVQDTATAPAVSSATTESAKAPTQEVADAIATQPPAESTQPTEAERLKTVRPLEGTEITAFAADHLAYNETTRDWRTHEGVDISAELGQTVTAAADGTVLTIYTDRSFGMTVVLQHAGGYTTHYSNLDEEVAVTAGQHVSAGDTLGTVGQTATVETATVPHLHFAVYLDNAPLDPKEFFALT